MSNKQLQASTDLFIRQFKWPRTVAVASVIAMCIFCIGVSWPDRTVPLPPGPRPAHKSSGSLPQGFSGLTHLLHWPLTPGDGGDLLASTSPQTSTYHLRSPAQTSYALGGYLEAILIARDHQGRPKAHGGDLFRAQLLGPDLKAGVPGDVTDLENGTYLLTLPLLWAGQAQVQVRLIHSSEAVRVLRGIWRDQWATVDFTGYFRGPTGYEETVTCNVNPLLIGEEEGTCHYRDEDSGELWFCARPPTLPCDSLVGHSSGRYWNVTTPHEEALLARPEAGGSTRHVPRGAADGRGHRPGHSAALARPRLAPALSSHPCGCPALRGPGTGGPGWGPPHCGGAEPGRPLHHLPSVHLRATIGRGPGRCGCAAGPGAPHPGGHQTGQHRLQVRVRQRLVHPPGEPAPPSCLCRPPCGLCGRLGNDLQPGPARQHPPGEVRGPKRGGLPALPRLPHLSAPAGPGAVDEEAGAMIKPGSPSPQL
ncbi:uncharacterized protein ACBT57_017024 isoform 2-T2 [Dama dama]